MRFFTSVTDSLLRVRVPVILWILGTLFFQVSTVHAHTDAFEPLESTIGSVRAALVTNSSTCRTVVSSFLSRIERFNPTINAVISLNPDALLAADELDKKLAAGNLAGKLLCVPVLLKDNYDAVGTNTTGSCADLAGNRPIVDTPSVKALKKEGAVILGKTNLHEMALEGLTVSSLGGQTINPYDQTRTPGGSSGGTDAVNSLRSPASANNLVSVRPTWGLISRAGIMPISYTQDSIGPIARNIQDLAVALTVMTSVGADEADNATLLVPPEARGIDYTRGLNDGSLNGLRIGLLDGFWNHTASDETTPVIDALKSTIDFLESEGVEIINVTESIYNASSLADFDVQQYEFKESLNNYLSSPNLTGDRPTTRDEVYESGKFLVIPAQYSFVNNSRVWSPADPGYTMAKQGIDRLKAAVNETFVRNKLDAVIYPEQKNLVVKIGSPSQAGRNGILAALTGVPVVTVPVGFSQPSPDAPIGVPIGMEILGHPFSEEKLLNIANHFTCLRPLRKTPAFANDTVPTKPYISVPVVHPNISNISPAYPLGVLY
ncbi:Glutamyl-tRNA(Gln) amidotransferase subunit A 2 [Daldinia childiae]|uniref:Glutamyl-tRNA(Gln) amidotransferase subunit A 2 n=1 Tax=Daldinia childiae TaxID=326645 RepID=UPI0014486379|nr:Glutamyl-tRNA(Gln) amidotransferase subunit A 2 [Daldinia childiae]KAF3061025.1 Glutamyl-tRNA(Gln) amidotransferase subunit A 2 [Daldinia childiae]